MFSVRLLWTGWFLCFFIGSAATAKAKCSSYSSHWLKKEVSFCIQRTRPDRIHENEPVIYFLHGLGGDESTWTKGGYGDALSAMVTADSQFPSMTFVSFETEMDSFFSDFQGLTAGSKAYETWFLNDFVPFIEEKFNVCSERKCRGVAGVSMGGFGALKLSLKYPELFSLGAANSPALPPFSIHESNDDWKKYFADTKIGIVKGMVLLRDVRNIFPTEELYQLNNPITLVEQFTDDRPFPDLYFDVGSEDNFGFQIGFEILKTTLNLEGRAFTSFLEEGGDHFIYHHRNKELLEFVKSWALSIDSF